MVTFHSTKLSDYNFLIDSICTICCFLKEPSKNFSISVLFISRTIWILPGFNLIGSKVIVVDECIAPVIGGITNSLKQQQPCQFSHLFREAIQTPKSNLELFFIYFDYHNLKNSSDCTCSYNDELVNIFFYLLRIVILEIYFWCLIFNSNFS